jgi:hypothetical protein
MTSPTIEHKYEFDAWPKGIGDVFLQQTDLGMCEVVLRCEGIDRVLLTANRDQWGVWLSAGDVEVASEDGTRSMLDGLIKCLQELRKMTEFEMKEATEVPNAPDL